MENSYNSGSSSERNEIIYGEENVVNQEVRFFSNSQSRIDTCMGYTGPALAAQIESIRRSFLEAKNRGVMLRYLTEITNANISYCKELISIVGELRHLDGIKGNFMISESEYLAPLVLFEHGKVAPQAVYSNFKEVVEQQQYIFDNFWNMGVPAGERIKEIEEGRTIHYETKVLRNQDEI